MQFGFRKGMQGGLAGENSGNACIARRLFCQSCGLSAFWSERSLLGMLDGFDSGGCAAKSAGEWEWNVRLR